MLLTLTVVVTAFDCLLILALGPAYWRRTHRLPVSLRGSDNVSNVYALLMVGGAIIALALQLAYAIATRPNQ
jgi:hypothetical protein